MSALTEEERALLMEKVAPAAEVPVDKPKRERKASAKAASTDLDKQDVDVVAANICERAGADREQALALVDDHVEAVFKAHTMSKVAAAANGIDKTEHNKALWSQVQTLRSALKTKVRAHYNGTTAAKVAKHTASKVDADDALIQTFVQSDAFMAALAMFKQQQEGATSN